MHSLLDCNDSGTTLGTAFLADTEILAHLRAVPSELESIDTVKDSDSTIVFLLYLLGPNEAVTA